jgi:hypothetical protein
MRPPAPGACLATRPVKRSEIIGQDGLFREDYFLGGRFIRTRRLDWAGLFFRRGRLDWLGQFFFWKTHGCILTLVFPSLLYNNKDARIYLASLLVIIKN